MAASTLVESGEKLAALTRQPENFIQPSPELSSQLKQILKHHFDFAKGVERSNGLSFGPLQELYIEGFNAEQIWSELELSSEPALQHVETQCNKLLQVPKTQFILGQQDTSARKANTSSPKKSPKMERQVEKDTAAGEDSDSESDTDSDSDSDSEAAVPIGPATEGMVQQNDSSSKAVQPPQKHNMNDLLAAMDAFAEQEERKEYGDEEDAEEEDDDGWQDALFSAGSEAEVAQAEKMKFSDLFSSPTANNEADGAAEGGREPTNPADSEGEEDDESEEQQNTTSEASGEMSAFQKAQLRLQKQIAGLEEEAIAAKAWSLVGEVTATKRPENSLLALHVDYETASAPVPVITQEVTSAVEDIIKKRIKDEAWDDVVRVMPEEDASAKPLPEVSQEQSKAGLGELYEAEYLKKALGLQSEEEEHKKNATRKLFQTLCDKLNALSNFHFTPKRANAELEVVQNLPSLAMEEVIPLAVSTGDLQAPGDIYKKKKGRAAALQGSSEMSREAKASQRRASKAAKRKRKRQHESEKKLVNRLNPGMGNKYSKREVEEEIRSARNIKQGTKGPAEKHTSSGAFFQKLQATVAADIVERANTTPHRKSNGKGSNHKL